MKSSHPAIPVFRQAFGAYADGILTMGHWSPYQKKWRGALAFFNAYKKRYKMEPDFLDSALTQVSLEILEQAVAKAGLDREKLREIISSETFDTINGKVKFKGVANTITPVGFLQLQKGGTQMIWPPEFATAKIQPKGAWPKK